MLCLTSENILEKHQIGTREPAYVCRAQCCLRADSWASYQIRKIAGCACAGNAGNVFPRHRFQRKPLISDPGMHHGTCVTHVPWCMLGSLTRGDRENVPGIPGACAPTILPIWQEVNSIVLLHSQNGLVWLTGRCHNTKRHQATYCCTPCYMLLVGQT